MLTIDTTPNQLNEQPCQQAVDENYTLILMFKISTSLMCHF